MVLLQWYFNYRAVYTKIVSDDVMYHDKVTINTDHRVILYVFLFTLN